MLGVVLGVTAASGVRMSLQVTALFTLIETGGLVRIMAVAVDAIVMLPAHVHELTPDVDPWACYQWRLDPDHHVVAHALWHEQARMGAALGAGSSLRC